MKQPVFLAALTPVVEALDDLNVRYYVGGSVASSAHGLGRSTADVDLVVELVPQKVELFASRLEQAYYLDREAIRDAIRRRGSFHLLHLESMVKIDVYLSRGRPFDRQAGNRTVARFLTGTEEGRRFELASAEDVILSKLEWYEAGGRTSERQLSDIQGVLDVQGTALDLEYLRRWAPELGVADLLERALAAAGLGT